MRRAGWWVLALGLASVASIATPASAACNADADCKRGRVCVSGQCVAAPAGGNGCSKDTDCKGDRVCDAGRCVEPSGGGAAPAAVFVPTPAPADPPPESAAPAPSAAPASAAPAPSAAPASAAPAAGATGAAAAKLELPTGLVVYPKLGLLVTGSGDYKQDGTYSGDTQLPSRSDSLSATDKSGFGLGLDLLDAISPGLRVGGGLLWVPSFKASVGGTETSGGNQLALVGIVEPVFPVGPSVAIAVRGQGGVSLLFPGGDLQNQIDEKKQDCAKDLADGDPKCDVSGGPGVGWTVGGGGGAIVPVGTVRLRADVLFQYLAQPLWKYEHTHQGYGGVGEYTHKVDYGVSGTRLWLMAGIEL